MLKWNIGTRLSTGFGLVLLILIVIGAVSYQSTNELMENASWVEHTHKVLADLEDVLGKLTDAETGQRGFLLTAENEYLEPYNAAVGVLRQDISDLKELTKDNPNQQRRLSKIDVLVTEKLTELNETIQLRRKKGLEAALILVRSGMGKKVMDNIRSIIDEMENEENALLKTRYADAMTSQNTATTTILGGTLLALILVILASFLITRSITNPIRMLGEKLKSIAQGGGDLTQKISVSTKDEIGALAQSFNQFQTSLIGILGTVEESSLKLQASSNEILSASEQQLVSTTEESSQSEQIKSTVVELLASAEQVKKSTDILGQSVASSSEASKKGGEAINSTIDNMNNITNVVEGTSKRIIELGKSGQRINDINVEISDVALQTKLLSLNASVEAAKAGEAGKGFAVVATEIRRLAEQVSKASLNVSNLTNEIQESTNSAVLSMEEANRAVAGGVKMVNDSGTAFQEIARMIDATQEQSVEIVNAMEQQKRANEEVNISISEITVAIEQTAAGTKQSNTAASELTALAAQLRQGLGQFKIRE